MSFYQQLKYPDKVQSKNFYLLYLGLLTFTGLSLSLIAFIFSWSAIFYWIAGFIVITGLLSFISVTLNGLVANINCPDCNHVIRVMHPKTLQINACPNCNTWLKMQNKKAEAVTDDYVSDYPSFIAKYPEKQLLWPKGCSVCGKSITRNIKITSVDEKGVMVNLVGIGLYKIYSMEVPACEQHEDGIALFVSSDKSKALGFRNFRYFKEFEKLNQ